MRSLNTSTRSDMGTYHTGDSYEYLFIASLQTELLVQSCIKTRKSMPTIPFQMVLPSTLIVHDGDVNLVERTIGQISDTQRVSFVFQVGHPVGSPLTLLELFLGWVLSCKSFLDFLPSSHATGIFSRRITYNSKVGLVKLRQGMVDSLAYR